jgi:DNA-binding NarL/FixJ family response regulator
MTRTKVLLVDDEELLRLTVSSDLTDAGYTVETAEDGHQACKKLAENSYDLIITDLIMEGLDGMQVLKESKRLDPTCSVILLTGYGHMDSAIESLRLGADDYLLKPYQCDELLFRLARCLEKTQLQRMLKKTEKKLRQSHTEMESKVHKRTLELQVKNQEISDANTTLRVLLEQQEKSKKEIEETISKNLKENIYPYLDILKEALQDKQETAYLTIIENNIHKITSSFNKKLSSELLNLTPREIQVANLIRQGRSSKDIAELLNLTPGTIEFYRQNLRKKLGISGQKTNLRSYLLSFPTSS